MSAEKTLYPHRFALGFGSLLALSCHATAELGEPIPPPYAPHSAAMAIAPDGKSLFVANADSDSISVVDVDSMHLVREIALGSNPPAADPSTGAFSPNVMPRSLAVTRDGKTLYVVGERSGDLAAVDVASAKVTRRVHVGSEPFGVVLSQDDANAYVTSAQDATVVRVDLRSMQLSATAKVADKPWAIAFRRDYGALLVTHFLGSGVSEIDPTTMTIKRSVVVPDVAPRGDRRLAHGQARGLYDVIARPNSDEWWVPHTLLVTDVAQPELDFESTAFPALAVLHSSGANGPTLSVDASDVPGIDGAFADVVAGPRHVAFTHDGAIAFVADSYSDDVLIVDAERRVELNVVRPLPGHLPEALVLSPDEKQLFVYERNTNDVAVFNVTRSSAGVTLTPKGAPIPTVVSDPMPAQIRLGQLLFNSANSDAYPVTTDHWVACVSCHMEGRTDGVVWRFREGPRDTPSNAGGTLGTGLLLRTGARAKVQDYWETINVEQGGMFDPNDPKSASYLDAIAAYVNLGIPLPIPPTTDAALVKRGADVWTRAECGTCHGGARLTDSGANNPGLDLSGPVVLHDVGTCATTPFADAPHNDQAGHTREACAFDTPSLNGVASSAPYLHDGSAPTLRDAIDRLAPRVLKAPLSREDEDALVEYLRSL